MDGSDGHSRTPRSTGYSLIEPALHFKTASTIQLCKQQSYLNEIEPDDIYLEVAKATYAIINKYCLLCAILMSTTESNDCFKSALDTRRYFKGFSFC